MKFNIGDIVYDGSGNRIFFSFIKVKITHIVANHYYKAEILEDYGSVWEELRSKTAIPGATINCLESTVFETYKKAKANLYKEMGFNNDRDSIKYYFESS